MIKIQKPVKALLTLIFFGILSSCKTDFLFDIYASDLFLDEKIKTSAQVEFEVSSCKSERLEEKKEEVLKLFSIGSNPKVVGCEERGMNSMLLVSTTAEIVSNSSSADFSLVRVSSPDLKQESKVYETRGIRLVISERFLRKSKEMMKENGQTISHGEIKIKIFINNDEADDIIVSGNNLWVNGEPYESYNRQKISRRQKIKLEFSDVTNALILNRKSPVGFYVGRNR
jgi:hypothetical protein